MRPLTRFMSAVALASVALAPIGATAAGVSVKSVEAVEGPDTVVKIHLSGPLTVDPHATLLPKTGGESDRLSIDLPGTNMQGKPARSVDVGWGGVRRIRLGMPNEAGARVVLDLDHPVAFEVAREGNVVAITLHDPRAEVILKALPNGAPPVEKPSDAKPGDTK